MGKGDAASMNGSVRGVNGCTEKVELEKKLGIFEGISLIVGGIVGSGIFISPKGVLQSTGSVGLSLSVWFVSGVITLIAALCYCELGTLFVRSGGEYTYIRKGFGNFPAFLCIWVKVALLQPSGFAVASLTFGTYFAAVFDTCGTPDIIAKMSAIACLSHDKVLTLFIIFIFIHLLCPMALPVGVMLLNCYSIRMTAVLQIVTTVGKTLALFIIIVGGFYKMSQVGVMLLNCYSIRMTAVLQIVTTVGKTLALFIIIVGGFYKMSQGHTKTLSTGFEGSTTDPSTIALSFYNSLFAYGGWNNLVMVVEELKNPSKNIPRANIISVIIVTVIYCLTNMAYLTVMTTQELLDAPAVAVLWGDRVLGSASIIIPVSVMISTLGAINAFLFSIGRCVFAAARDGNLPEVLSFLNVRRNTPLASMLFTICTSIVFLFMGDISSLIDFISFTNWMFYGLTFATIIMFRFTMKSEPRPYKVPIILAIFSCLISIYLVIAPVIKNPSMGYLFAVLFMVGGAVIYFPFIHFKVKVPYFEQFTMYSQLVLEISPPTKVD